MLNHKYIHRVLGSDYPSALKTNCNIPYNAALLHKTSELPIDTYVDFNDCDLDYELHELIPTLMLRNEGAKTRVVLCEATNITNKDDPKLRNELKRKILNHFFNTDLKIDLYGYPSVKSRTLSYSYLSMHMRITILIKQALMFDFFVDRLVDIYLKTPRQFELLGIKLKSRKYSNGFGKEFFIPGSKDGSYYKVVNHRVNGEISLES